jgi:hypothetical protein
MAQSRLFDAPLCVRAADVPDSFAATDYPER